MTPATAPEREWKIHPQLLADSVPIVHLPVCAVRLLDDRRFPWVLLIPRLPGLTQWLDVPLTVQHRILDEIQLVSATLHALYTPDRINLATIGNRVDQLHIHCVARHTHDAAWPDVVWGQGERQPYSPLNRLAQANAIAAGLKTQARPNSEPNR